MPSRRSGDLILFSADDPRPLVEFLVENHGLQNILRLLSEQQPGGTRAASTGSKSGSKKGGKRGRPTGSKNGSKKASKKGGAKKSSKKAGGKSSKKATSGGNEVGNG